MALWSQLRSPRLALLLVTLALCLDPRPRSTRPRRRGSAARRQRSFPPIWRSPRSPSSRWPSSSGVESRAPPGPRSRGPPLFCTLVLATGAANGAAAFVSGAKLVELSALGLGDACARRREAHSSRRSSMCCSSSRSPPTPSGSSQFVTGGGGRRPRFSASTTSQPSRRCRSSTGSRSSFARRARTTSSTRDRRRERRLHPRRGARQPARPLSRRWRR